MLFSSLLKTFFFRVKLFFPVLIVTRESWCNASMSPEIHTAVMHNTNIVVVEKTSYQLKGILEHQGWGQVKIYHNLHFFCQRSECPSLKYNWSISFFMTKLHSKVDWLYTQPTNYWSYFFYIKTSLISVCSFLH